MSFQCGVLRLDQDGESPPFLANNKPHCLGSRSRRIFPLDAITCVVDTHTRVGDHRGGTEAFQARIRHYGGALE